MLHMVGLSGLGLAIDDLGDQLLNKAMETDDFDGSVGVAPISRVRDIRESPRFVQVVQFQFPLLQKNAAPVLIPALSIFVAKKSTDQLEELDGTGAARVNGVLQSGTGWISGS